MLYENESEEDRQRRLADYDSRDSIEVPASIRELAIKKYLSGSRRGNAFAWAVMTEFFKNIETKEITPEDAYRDLQGTDDAAIDLAVRETKKALTKSMTFDTTLPPREAMEKMVKGLSDYLQVVGEMMAATGAEGSETRSNVETLRNLSIGIRANIAALGQAAELLDTKIENLGAITAKIDQGVDRIKQTAEESRLRGIENNKILNEQQRRTAFWVIVITGVLSTAVYEHGDNVLKSVGDIIERMTAPHEYQDPRFTDPPPQYPNQSCLPENMSRPEPENMSRWHRCENN